MKNLCVLSVLRGEKNVFQSAHESMRVLGRGKPVAVYRQLTITFQENGDVAYQFFRSSADGNLTRYLIAYPAERVSVSGGENLTCDNFRSSITREGHVLLTWERGPGGKRGIHYNKIGFLESIQPEPRLLHYQESIRIKNERQPAGRDGQPNVFLLKVHDRNQRLSAVESRSQAVFHCTSRGTIHTCQALLRHSHGTSRLVCSEHPVEVGERIRLRPTELVGAQFICAGVLSIDWILEIDPAGAG